MTNLVLAALTVVLMTGVSAASAQSLGEAQVRSVIASWYSLFNVIGRGDVKAIEEQILTADYESCSGYLPSECWGRDHVHKGCHEFCELHS